MKKFTYTDFIHITWFCIETAESDPCGRSLLLEIKCQPKLWVSTKTRPLRFANPNPRLSRYKSTGLYLARVKNGGNNPTSDARPA